MGTAVARPPVPARKGGTAMTTGIRALTICQPFAELIVADANTLPPGESPKRVENRVWPAAFRGDILIHAGKSTAWFDRQEWDREQYPVPMGAIVGIATLADCIYIDRIRRCERAVVERFPWITTHEHAEGPYCFVLEHVRRFVNPIPYRGALGFFYVPSSEIAGAKVVEAAS